MTNKTKSFVDEIISSERHNILSIEILGSREGENNLNISDIDFLIICSNKKDIKPVFDNAIKAEEKIYGIRPTKINKFIQKFFLGSNSYKGVHLIIFGVDELDKNFHPTSLRLRFMTKLIGINLFMYEIKQNHQLLYGKNLIDEIQIKHPKFSEKLACFLFPSFVLLLSFPSFFFSRNTFKIWCFKAIKYHNISLRAFAKITKQEQDFNNELLQTAKYFRYRPDEYNGNSLLLYFQVWGEILKNITFLFKKAKK